MRKVIRQAMAANDEKMTRREREAEAAAAEAEEAEEDEEDEEEDEAEEAEEDEEDEEEDEAEEDAPEIVDGIRVPGGTEYWRAKRLHPDGTKERLMHGQTADGLAFQEWAISDFSVSEVRARWGEGEYQFVWLRRTDAGSGAVKLNGNSGPIRIGPKPRGGDAVPITNSPAPPRPRLVPPPAPDAPPVSQASLEAFPVMPRYCVACGGVFPSTARFCGNCGAQAGSVRGAPTQIPVMPSAGAGFDAGASSVLTAFERGQQNMLAVFSHFESSKAAELQAATERARIEANERIAQQRIDFEARERGMAAVFREIRSVDRDREPPQRLNEDSLVRRFRDEMREELEELEDSIDERLTSKETPPAQSATAETINAVSNAVTAFSGVAQPLAEAVGRGIASANVGGAKP
jgi:hypothetical protein